MSDEKTLTPAEKAELKYLRDHVDQWQDKMLSNDPPSDAKIQLFYARAELGSFVKSLRTKGRSV